MVTDVKVQLKGLPYKEVFRVVCDFYSGPSIAISEKGSVILPPNKACEAANTDITTTTASKTTATPSLIKEAFFEEVKV